MACWQQPLWKKTGHRGCTRAILSLTRSREPAQGTGSAAAPPGTMAVPGTQAHVPPDTLGGDGPERKCLHSRFSPWTLADASSVANGGTLIWAPFRKPIPAQTCRGAGGLGPAPHPGRSTVQKQSVHTAPRPGWRPYSPRPPSEALCTEMLARRRALGFPTWLLLGPKPQAPGTSTTRAHSTQAQTSLPDRQKAGWRPGAGVSPQTKGTAHVWVPPWQGSKEAVGPAARFTQPASRGPTVTPRLPHPWPHVCVARQPPCHAFSLFCRARARMGARASG